MEFLGLGGFAGGAVVALRLEDGAAADDGRRHDQRQDS
jgi:hypothetical protein